MEPCTAFAIFFHFVPWTSTLNITADCTSRTPSCAHTPTLTPQAPLSRVPSPRWAPTQKQLRGIGITAVSPSLSPSPSPHHSGQLLPQGVALNLIKRHHHPLHQLFSHNNSRSASLNSAPLLLLQFITPASIPCAVSCNHVSIYSSFLRLFSCTTAHINLATSFASQT